MLAFYADQGPWPLPGGHSFPSTKYELLKAAVHEGLAGVRLVPSQPASDGELALAHEPQWIEAVAMGTLSAARQREIGFPWSERLVQRARRSVGATVAAARAALFEGEGVAAQLGGGTHHAYADKGGGYCVFNDVAVAARLMQAQAHRESASLGAPARHLRVWVIDLDVHQGNGTASIFRDDPSVFTWSVHGARNFPFRKEPSDFDIELPDGCADADYLEAVRHGLDSCWHRMQADVLGPPRLAFYLAGADPHEDDRLGRLKLSREGLAQRDRLVLEHLDRHGVAVAVCMAGGYGRRVETTVEIHRRSLELAHQAWLGRQAAGRPYPARFAKDAPPHARA